MTMLNHLTAFAGTAIQAMRPLPPVFTVDLIDRVTGRHHCIAGIPVTVMTRDPDIATRDLLRNRDRSRWTTRTTPLHGELQ
ncbi:hypothetical protein FNJ84_08715 [Paracoccus sp. M683]|uniref:hypothetical protein n=1 Tax=Paracoccus sp. M683 TaxID=2594268 RepID=UPI0011813A67|nr:hypothetical protein [Paracoccus sp. M683]TRW97575.1 hypothetical protein FNJ84_08715 [Paracoccus sp. M683]